MDVITLDFESFYSKEFSLSKLSTQQYVDGKEFEVIGVAVKVNDGETVWYDGDFERSLAKYDWENSIAVAHNALFDATILTWRYGIKPKLWVDTLSMARAVHGTEVGGSLKALAEHYQIGVKGEEVLNALGKHSIDFEEDELARYGEYCRNDVELTYKLFGHLAPHFNRTEMQLIDMTIRMHTEPKFELDLDVLEQHLYDVKKAKEETLQECGVSKEDLMSNDKFAEVLRTLGVEPPTKISPTTGKTAYAFAKTDDGLKDLQEHDDIRVQAVVAARLSNKTTIEETRTQKFIDIANARDTIPIGLKYYGALTGRWSATEGTNFQNLPRTSPLKKAIKAPKGYKVVGADLSAIELRVGLFFANQMDKMALIADGVDLYKDFAAKVFHVDYDDVDKDMRFIGKTSQLSLVYGTGHKKLRNQIKVMSGKDIGEELAKNIVELYRNEYASVKQSWYEGEETLQCIHGNYAFKFGLGPLKLTVEGERGIRLPSGLFLRYPQLTQRETEKGHEWVYNKRPKLLDKLYGSKTFQGCTQALARCVMGEAMVRINKKYPLSLTVHDSCYAVVPEAEAQEAFDYIIKQLTTPPVWLPGIVLGAEGGIGDTLKDGG